jgi:Fic family protein
MKRFVLSLRKDIDWAVQAGSIDPVALAAKYCREFVNIHQFLDGNGRV